MQSSRMRPIRPMNLDEVALHYYEGLDSAKALSCAILSRYKAFDQLVSMECKPLDYADPLLFAKDYAAVSFLKKNPFVKTSFDREKTAYQKFLSAEQSCSATNRFLECVATGRVSPLFSQHNFDSKFRGKIASILGEIPYSFADLEMRFGPGATFGVRGNTSPRNKLSSALECAGELHHYLPELLAEFPGWITDPEVSVNVVPCSDLAFVPKNAKTDRSICIEPTLNGMVQLGIGKFLKRRLLRYGIDLSDQTVNQKLAKHAYFNGLATVDLSSASDTIAYRLVLDYFPINWVNLLLMARTPAYHYKGDIKPLSKWSSMGNGYTFEIETVIFLAAVLATLEVHDIEFSVGNNESLQPGTSVSVYGDDIILPTVGAKFLIQNLKVLGFETNIDKTFISGPFYESCGKDFFAGQNVRPFFFQRKGCFNLEDYYFAYNSTTVQIHRIGAILHGVPSDNLGHQFNGFLSHLVRSVPEQFRYRVPPPFIEAGFYTPFDKCHPTRHSSWCGFSFRGLIRSPVKVACEDSSAFALYTSYAGLAVDSQVSGFDVIRTRLVRRTSRFFSPTWDNVSGA